VPARARPLIQPSLTQSHQQVTFVSSPRYCHLNSGCSIFGSAEAAEGMSHAGSRLRLMRNRGAGYRTQKVTHDNPQLRRRGINFMPSRAEWKWLIGPLLAAIALGILVGLVASGRLRMIF
jgi:hypothetical protein